MAMGRFVLRATVGGLILGHGLQKLNGSFGGPGLEGTEKTMAAIGMHPAKHQARAAALSETIGGALTAAGLFSPLGPAMVIGTQAVAINKVHAKNGIWAHEGGFEYNLTLIAAAITLAAEGPGPISLDGMLRKQRKGLHWGILSAGLGLGAAMVAMRLAERFAPAAQDIRLTEGTSAGTEPGTDVDLNGHEMAERADGSDLEGFESTDIFDHSSPHEHVQL
jgi:putative oxidoreductase